MNTYRINLYIGIRAILTSLRFTFHCNIHCNNKSMHRYMISHIYVSLVLYYYHDKEGGSHRLQLPNIREAPTRVDMKMDAINWIRPLFMQEMNLQCEVHQPDNLSMHSCKKIFFFPSCSKRNEIRTQISQPVCLIDAFVQAGSSDSDGLYEIAFIE